MNEVPSTEEPVVENAQVRCRFTSIQDPSTLHPHPSNPNEHGEKQIELFKAILVYQGWRRPITVSTRSNFVTKGHGALAAALSAGYTEVPVEYQDYDNEEQELADIVADNTLQRMSEMNTGKLQKIVTSLNVAAFDLSLTGLETKALDKLLGVKKAPEYKLSPEGETLVGAPVEPGSEYVPNEGGESESAFVPSIPPGASEPVPYIGAEARAPDGRMASNQVRMVQLFFTEENLAEFMELSHFFQAAMNINNTTDVVLAVLRKTREGYVQ